MKYTCPYATRLRQHDFILCKNLIKQNIDYTQINNALTAFCAYQYKCNITGKAENTDRARQCYNKQHQQK